MTGLDSLGRMLMLLGGVLVLLGLVLVLTPKLPFLSRLPGDLVLRRGNSQYTYRLPPCSS